MRLPSEYLRGVALFNAGAFFECHEALEPLWQASHGEERTFLHALIQVAAALHHRQRGNHNGAASVYARARQKLLSLPPEVMSLSIPSLLRQTDVCFASAETDSLPQIHLNVPPELK